MRLAFAVAAHLDPEILIVDEVLAVGDAEFQKKCLGKMGDVAKEGRTVLFVSHNMGAISNLCTNTTLVNHGKLVVKGITSEVINLYLQSGLQKQQQLLKNRTDRKGNNVVLIENIDLIDKYDSQLINCLSQLKFLIKFSTLTEVNNLKVLIGIYDDFERPVYFLNNEMSGSKFLSVPQTGVITCETSAIKLTSGIFRVNVALLVDGQIADHIQNAISFIVEPYDYFHCGQILENRTSLCYIDQTWSIKNARND